MAWQSLSNVAQLDEINTLSINQPVVIFKHSTRCSISFMAKSRLESSWNYGDDEVHVYLLDLIQDREVSNAVASQYEIEHASPQVLMIKNGEVIYHTSHNDIRSESFKDYL